MNPAELKTPLTGQERILFVDDEKSIAILGEKLLEMFGYLVRSETGSREALAVFSANPDQFDLIITDQTMPGLSGLELARKIHALRPDIPVILCTGHSSMIPEQKALASGIKAFLMKPATRQTLAETVRRVLDQQKAL
jgi:CheY-like chemotaxis protein